MQLKTWSHYLFLSQIVSSFQFPFNNNMKLMQQEGGWGVLVWQSAYMLDPA